jgi:hypothetical protein
MKRPFRTHFISLSVAGFFLLSLAIGCQPKNSAAKEQEAMKQELKRAKRAPAEGIARSQVRMCASKKLAAANSAVLNRSGRPHPLADFAPLIFALLVLLTGSLGAAEQEPYKTKYQVIDVHHQGSVPRGH